MFKWFLHLQTDGEVTLNSDDPVHALDFFGTLGNIKDASVFEEDENLKEVSKGPKKTKRKEEEESVDKKASKNDRKGKKRKRGPIEGKAVTLQAILN